MAPAMMQPMRRRALFSNSLETASGVCVWLCTRIRRLCTHTHTHTHTHKDPSEALKLLEKAISSEALADMVEKNRAMDEELLSTLQGNLEGGSVDP